MILVKFSQSLWHFYKLIMTTQFFVKYGKKKVVVVVCNQNKNVLWEENQVQ